VSAKLCIGEHLQDGVGKRMRPVGDQDGLPMDHVDPLAADGRAHHRFAHRECLENLEPSSASRAQGHDAGRDPVHPGPDVVHETGHRNVARCPLAKSPRWGLADDKDPRVRQDAQYQREHLVEKPDNTVQVRQVVHRAGEDKRVSIRTRADRLKYSRSTPLGRTLQSTRGACCLRISASRTDVDSTRSWPCSR